MKELQRDIQIMENFEQIYTQKLDDTTAGSDLSVSQITALFAFNNGNCLSMKELAKNLGVKISRVNTIADSLIKDGIAECTQTNDKSNPAKVRLTPQGKNIRDQIAANRCKLAETIYVRLSDKDKVALIDSLDTAYKILKKSLRNKKQQKGI
jgi:DNA-binding MarR family transcriptional regulator